MNNTEIYTNEYMKFWHRQFSDKITWLFDNYEIYFETWEDDFFETITKHEDLFNTDQIVTMFRDAFVPLIIPLITTIIALFTIFVIPRCCYMQLCRSRRSITEFKHAWFFGVKIFLTLNILTLLFTFTTASILSSMNLESAMRNNIKKANNVVDELHNRKAKFELQLHEVNNTIVTTLQSIRNMIDTMPRSIFDSLNIYVENDLNTARKSYNLIMSKKDIIFERSGLIINDDTIENIIEIDLKNLGTFVEMFNNNTDILTTAIENNKYIFSNNNNIRYDLNVIRNYMKRIRGHYHYPNWHQMHKNLQDTYFTLMPKINESLAFMHEYPSNIKNSIKRDIEYVYNVTENFKNETEIIIKHLFNITRNIYHEDLRKNIRNILNVTTASLYAINRNNSLWSDTYFSSIIIAIPSIHCYICAFLILFICLSIIYQVKCNNGGNFVMITKFKKCTTIWMKLIILFALSLLWTGLVLAAICYIGALSLSMICRPIMSDHLYTKYTDNIQVWENKTWLDHIVYPWHHNYKLKDILEKCSRNITVYKAFEVEKYWKVSNLFENNKIILNKEELMECIKIAIDSVKMPNGDICNIAKIKMNAVEKEITLLSPHIMYDVELFQNNNNIKIHLENMLEKYGQNILELQENLEILNNIEKLKVDTVLSNFMEFKYLLKTQQNELTYIEHMEHEIVNKLNKTFNILIKNKVNNITKTINNILINLEEHISDQIENEIGNCYIYPNAMAIIKETACIQMPQLFNMTWVLVSFSAVFLLLSTFFCCQLCSSINEIRNERKIWLEKIEFDKLNNRRKRLLSGTLLFDRSGRFMGDSRTLLSQDAPEALIIHPNARSHANINSNSTTMR